MPLRGRSSSAEIDLKAVLSFLQTLWCMAAGIAVLAACGMILSAFAGQVLVVYQMTLVVDLVMLVGGGFMLRVLRQKDRQLDEKKENG